MTIEKNSKNSGHITMGGVGTETVGSGSIGAQTGDVVKTGG